VHSDIVDDIDTTPAQQQYRNDDDVTQPAQLTRFSNNAGAQRVYEGHNHHG